jgi:predicted GNAT family acetyltransferase
MTTDKAEGKAKTAAAQNISIANNPAEFRVEIKVDGALAGFTTYRDGPNARAFDHTEIAEQFGGMGLASKLIGYALDDARAAGRKVLPFCPFVRSFIAKHPAYLDLVTDPARFQLG